MLENENIILHFISREDTGDIVRWRNQDFVRQRFIYQEDFTIESHMEWMETKVSTGEAVQFIIEYKKDHKRVGSVYLRDIDDKNNKAEFGIFLGEKDYIGKGIGSEAAKLILDYAFNTMNLNKVFLRVLADNVRAARSYEKAGFKREGYFEQDIMMNGEYCDVIFMGVCADRFQ